MNDCFRFYRCIFVVGYGVFFVNYVITVVFIGIVLELIRFFELFMYVFKFLFVYFLVEKIVVRKVNICF